MSVECGLTKVVEFEGRREGKMGVTYPEVRRI